MDEYSESRWCLNDVVSSDRSCCDSCGSSGSRGWIFETRERSERSAEGFMPTRWIGVLRLARGYRARTGCTVSATNCARDQTRPTPNKSKITRHFVVYILLIMAIDDLSQRVSPIYACLPAPGTGSRAANTCIGISIARIPHPSLSAELPHRQVSHAILLARVIGFSIMSHAADCAVACVCTGTNMYLFVLYLQHAHFRWKARSVSHTLASLIYLYRDIPRVAGGPT
jgi:hypothetical protein